ncbi:PatU [Halomicronema hongdechloris]|uniref:PatU n=1 Tax=Halomicronema hongdechloris TaxID=1209493 RepID=UPI0010CB9A7A|nr:PatU [Halomicronema hongdechloris]
MQDRFQALLKRQLQLDIERRPPLFPWEKELQDYPVDMPSELASTTPGPLPYLWLHQLRSLSLPTPLPDELLDTLLQRCQALIQRPLKSGVRLVKVVETLFPEQPQAVERLAGMVLTPAYRGQLMTDPGTTELTYDQANPQQQMALSLLAARQIFDTLILDLSAQQPQVSRQWMTDVGLLRLTASYEAEAARVMVQAELPAAGRVSLGQAPQRATSTSSTGPVTVTLEDVSAQVYALEVELAGTALQFAIHLT